MALQATPQNLAEVWNLPVGAFNPGMRAFEQMQQADQGALQRMASEEAYKAQERPLTLAQMAGQNRNRDAEFPGIQARSRQAQLNYDKDLTRYDNDQERWFAENKSAITKAHIEQALNAGQTMQMLAEDAWNNASPGYQGRVKEKLIRAGHGDLWNPQWDSLPPDRLAMVLSQYGTGIMGTVPKFQQQMALQESKNATSERNTDVKADTQLQLQTQRAALGRELAQIRAKSGGSKTQLPRLEQLLGQAMQNGDMETASLIADTIRYTKARDEVKPQINPNIAPEVFTPPKIPVNPLKPKDTKPKTGDKLPDGSIFIE